MKFKYPLTQVTICSLSPLLATSSLVIQYVVWTRIVKVYNNTCQTNVRSFPNSPYGNTNLHISIILDIGYSLLEFITSHSYIHQRRGIPARRHRLFYPLEHHLQTAAIKPHPRPRPPQSPTLPAMLTPPTNPR